MANATVEPAASAAVTVRMEPPGELVVTITDEKTCEGVASARIMLQPRDGGEVRQLFSDESGVVRVELPAGDYTIANLGADGYLSKQRGMEELIKYLDELLVEIIF